MIEIVITNKGYDPVWIGDPKLPFKYKNSMVKLGHGMTYVFDCVEKLPAVWRLQGVGKNRRWRKS